MKAKVFLKMFVVSAVLLVASIATSARSNDGQLIYNPVEEIVIEEMEKAYRMHVPLKADCGWGKNWLEAH